MPKRLYFVGTSGWFIEHVPGAAAHIAPVACVPMKTQRLLATFPPSLLLPFCLWEMADDGGLHLVSTACVDHWVQSVGGTVGLSAKGLKSIASALVSRHKRPTFTEALSRRTFKTVQELIGKGFPGLKELTQKEAGMIRLPGIHRDVCWAYRCGQGRSPAALFCTKCLEERRKNTGIALDRLNERELDTPTIRREMYRWTLKHVHTPAAPQIAAAALYFQAHAEPIETLRLLGAQLLAVGLDELCMVAAGMRPVGRAEIAAWSAYFYWLQGHAEIHAFNAVRLVGDIRRETVDYKRVLARELAVYGIITDEFDPNPVSAVPVKSHGAWSYRELVELGGLAEGAVVKLGFRTGYVLYTALFAALVLTGLVAHSFTWAVVKPGYVPTKAKFVHTFDGLAFNADDRRALERLGSAELVLVKRAGLLSWSGLYAFITRCRATVYFMGSPPFTKIAVFDERLQRHVGGPFALLHAAAVEQGRILPPLVTPKASWDDLLHAMGPQRAGLCTKCGKSHAMEFVSSFYYPDPADTCTETAVAKGSTIDVMAATATARIHQLLDAAKEVARTL